MTTLRRIELRCPICDNSFHSDAVVSTDAFGGKRTDFHERASGKQPLAYLVHMCRTCGYSGLERDFADEAEVSVGLKEHVWKELAPSAARWFESALASYDGVPQDERAVITYLVGELWRRIGDVKLAGDWFERVAVEVIDPDTQQWVILVAEEQRREPQEWFS